MKISEMITLIGKGYTPSDIKEISDLSKGNSDILNLAASVSNMTELNNLIALSGDEQEEETATIPQEDAGESDQTTPEKDKDDKIAELEEMVRKLQNENRKEDLSQNTKVTDDEILNDLMQSCY